MRVLREQHVAIRLNADHRLYRGHFTPLLPLGGPTLCGSGQRHFLFSMKGCAMFSPSNTLSFNFRGFEAAADGPFAIVALVIVIVILVKSRMMRW
jgi:hypothetical protein